MFLPTMYCRFTHLRQMGWIADFNEMKRDGRDETGYKGSLPYKPEVRLALSSR